MRKITNPLRIIIFLFLVLNLTGCKTTPKNPTTPEMITINTTPSGADIYVEGQHAGKSPLSIQAPKDYRGEESIKIEARLEGHENKSLILGDYYPEHSRFMLGAGGGRGGVSIFGSSSIGQTTPRYYRFPDSVNIKLEPKKP